MNFLHACQVIHTDLKPENILLYRRFEIPPDLDKEKHQAWAHEHNDLRLEADWRIKIVDLGVSCLTAGNACWFNQHFTDDVQTRQYRSPEVILGQKYTEAIDIWSVGCQTFELLTGDLLFDPKNGLNSSPPGSTYGKEDDHLAQMIELLGRMPRPFTQQGTRCKEFFNNNGDLKAMKKNMNPHWPLSSVLKEKYSFSAETSAAVSAFICGLLRFVPSQRWTAAQALEQS